MRYSRATVLMNPALPARRLAPIRDLLHWRLKRLARHVHVPDSWQEQETNSLRTEMDLHGKELVVVVGGDGTINRAVNWLLKPSQRPPGGIVLGMIPLGTACSLARELAIPRGLKAIRLLSEGLVRKIDLIGLRWLTPEGEQKNWFVTTLVHFGFGGAVVNSIRPGLKRLGGFLGFGLTATRELFRYKTQEVAVELDGVQIACSRLLCVIAANSRCEGGGMCVAPAARPDDGLLDMVIVRDLPTLSRLTRFPTVYAGRHIRLRAVSSFKGKTVVVRADSPLPFEFDGEPGLCLDCVMELVPSTLKVIVPQSYASSGPR